MIGEILIIKPHHLAPAREIADIILEENSDGPKRYVVSIAGENGSGKATLAMALKHVLNEKGVKSFIFHMDDYFHKPPTSNHLQRLEDINHVGPQEVDLELLEKHICQVKKGLSELIKPMCHYKENEIRKEIVTFDSHQVIIVEGIYASMLDYVDKKVFIDRNYLENAETRKDKGKSPYPQFFYQVLEIEHEIVKQQKELSDIILDADYELTFNTKHKTVES